MGTTDATPHATTTDTDQDRGRLAAAVRVLVEGLTMQAVTELERYETHPRRDTLEEARRLLTEADASVRALHALAYPADAAS